MVRIGLVLVALSVVGGVGCVATGDPEASEDADTRAEALQTRGGYAGTFNRAGQGHADACVKLKDGAAELRYPDFSPTGYTLTTAQLKFTDKGACDDGYVQLDAREILETPSGRLFFHRGGNGYEGGGSVKYGHLWIADLASHVDVEPGGGNGAPCTAAKDGPNEGHYAVKPQAIPGVMHYCKTSGSCADEASTNSYRSYGDPAQQGDALPGVHYTYLSWSWINVQGGGVVRTLLKDGDVFHRCDVPAIKLASVTDTGQKNGWVKAIYGKTRQGGSWIYGWTVHSHQYRDEPVVYHVENLDELYD